MLDPPRKRLVNLTASQQYPTLLRGFTVQFSRIRKSIGMGIVTGSGAFAAALIGLTAAPSAAAAGYGFMFGDATDSSSLAGIADDTTSTGGGTSPTDAFFAGELDALQNDPAFTTDPDYQLAGENLVTAQQGFINSLNQLNDSYNELYNTLFGSGANWSEVGTEFLKLGTAFAETGSTVLELVSEGIKFDEASPEHLEIPVLIIAG